MSTVALVLVVLVALLHLYFLVLEMLLWTRPLGLKTFRNTPEKAEITIDSSKLSVAECVDQVIRYLEAHGRLKS